MIVVSGLVDVERPWDRTVDSRSKIASAPLSRRAELLVLATHADSGPDSSSQEDSLSRFSPVTPLRINSSATEAAIALAFFDLLLVTGWFALFGVPDEEFEVICWPVDPFL